MSLRQKRKLESRQLLIDAGFTLRQQKQSFSNISLRELTREVGLAPTAFYRHFKDMSELGAEMVQEASNCLHQLIPAIRTGLQHHTGSASQQSLAVFFLQVDANKERWEFLIGERWGGNAFVSMLLRREFEVFEQQLKLFLAEFDEFANLKGDVLSGFVDLLVNLFCAWGITWLSQVNFEEALQTQKRLELMQKAGRQIKLLFKGVTHC